MSVVQCGDLTKCYGKLKAIDHLSFEIEENKITGLIGRKWFRKNNVVKDDCWVFKAHKWGN